MMTAAEMKELLLNNRHNAATLKPDDVPRQRGLYAWYSIESGDLLYVGKATGRRGLRGRICSQHLNPQYVETRPEKFRPADEFQLSCGEVGGKVCVDKSVFRRSIGRRFKLAPGEPTVRYIKEKLAVAWLTADVVGDVPKCELELIQVLEPVLNVSGTKKASPE